jgi:uncharacterized membrane protein
MNTIINRITYWFNANPKAKQWGWFVALWLGGLISVMAMAYPIKWLIRSLG